MKKYIILNYKNVEYELVYSRRKSIGLELNELGELKVRAPLETPTTVIESVLLSKSKWIMDKKKSIEFTNSKRVIQTFESGSFLRYIGKTYELRVKRVDQLKNQEVFICEDIIWVYTIDHNPDNIKSMLIKWYQERSREILLEKSLYYSRALHVEFKAIKINNPKKRWGSCSSKGNINYNWRIIMATETVIDYLVVHELAHLRQMNHSNKFYSLIESILPNYKKEILWLKENGKYLEL